MNIKRSKDYKCRQMGLNVLKNAIDIISFDTRINNTTSSIDILKETSDKILSIYNFSGICFYLVNEEDGSFYQSLCVPENLRDRFEEEHMELVDSGVFSLALVNNAPQFSLSIDEESFLLIHPIATPRRIRGIFLAKCDVGRDKFPEDILYLLTLILFSCASLIESYEIYRYLNKINHELRIHVEELEILNKKLTHEISIRKERELQLKRSEEKYRSIIENIDDAYVELDIYGNITFCNESLLKITGYKREEMIGKNFTEFTDKQYLRLIRREIKNVLLEKSVAKYNNWKFYTKTGDVIWVESFISPIKDDGDNIIGFRSILRDVTDRIKYQKKLEQSEKRYKTIFETTAIPTIIVDNKGIIVMANQEMLKLFGYSKEEIEGKKSIKDFVYPEDLDMVWSFHVQKKKLGKDAPRKLKCRAVDRWGNIKQLMVSSDIIPDSSDSIVSIVDLTEQEELESQLRQARKFEALGTLAGGIAHEFNNILQGMKTNFELLELKYKHMLKDTKILSSTKDLIYRSEVIVNRLLTFSRKTDIKMEPVDLNKVLNASHELLRGAIRKGINIKIHYCKSPMKVMGDEIQLEEVIVNLVNNGVDAIGDRNQGLIEVGLACLKKCDLPKYIDKDFIRGDRAAHLWVRDNGCGIEEKDVEKIFTPFYTTKEPGKGTGLGLSIVYGIVKAHKGQIFCESKVGVGTTFNMFFPLVDEELKQSVKESVEEVKDDLHGVVMVVDDEEIIREVVKESLELKGLDVIVATSSEEALSYLKKGERVDLVLMDLDMPGMGGSAGIKNMLSLKPELKIVICTGYGKDIISDDPRHLGAVDFLKKPFGLDKLFSVVLRHLK